MSPTSTSQVTSPLAKFLAVVVAAAMVLALSGSVALGHASSSQNTWSIGSCQLWGEQFMNSSNNYRTTVWDRNGNCGTVRVRMRYYNLNGNIGLTGWYSDPVATLIDRAANDGIWGEFEGSGVTKRLNH